MRVLALLWAAGAATAANVTTQDVFTTGLSTFPWSAGKWACYRIPALLNVGDGALLAFAAERVATPPSRSCSDDNEIHIVQRRSVDGGATWKEAELVFSPGTSTSPWPVYDPATRVITLFTNVDTAGCHCDVQYLTSSDGGATWSAPTVLSNTSAYGSGLTHGVALSAHASGAPGRLVACMRKICRNSCPLDYHSAAVYSDDHGASWSQSAWLGAGTTECQVAELPSGDLYMTSRPYIGWKGMKNVRLASWSQDGGATWGAVEAVPGLVDNGFACEGSLTSDPLSDRVYFVHPDAAGRTNLTLYTSTGNASAWQPAVQIYKDASEYSDVVVVDPAPHGAGRTVGIIYEADNCGRLAFARVTL
eukprot:TRINITY_DN29707_c0_g1_i1.p1 TRINITY_DN29707_c0_g1~~TRINITY_DN29707_c0_g1_i1.p1  ORF type:complete len:362 (+),score=80.81 TRINITY_DN29707_c0_g1_i1:49-1134(+)